LLAWVSECLCSFERACLPAHTDGCVCTLMGVCDTCDICSEEDRCTRACISRTHLGQLRNSEGPPARLTGELHKWRTMRNITGSSVKHWFASTCTAGCEHTFITQRDASTRTCSNDKSLVYLTNTLQIYVASGIFLASFWHLALKWEWAALASD